MSNLFNLTCPLNKPHSPHSLGLLGNWVLYFPIQVNKLDMYVVSIIYKIEIINMQIHTLKFINKSFLKIWRIVLRAYAH